MNGVISRLRPEPTTRSRPTGAEGATVTLLPIGADLLPRGTAAERRGRGTRWVAVGVVVAAVLAVTAAWLLATRGHATATDALTAAQDQQRSLQATQEEYADLVATRQQATDLRNTLASLMATDTPWSTLLTELGRVRGGVTFTSVDGALATAGTGSGDTGAASGPATTPGAIGTLTVEGTAPDKPTIAAFVEQLDTLGGLADPFLSTVAEQSDGGGYTFTVSVALTGDLRTAAPGRWAPTTGGGK
ncbi:PilN domain-containing protein [Jatrophihabitans sp. YIM 134969]